VVIIEFLKLYIDENKMNNMINMNDEEQLIQKILINNPISSSPYLHWLQIKWKEEQISNEEIITCIDKIFLHIYPNRKTVLYNKEPMWLYYLCSYASKDLLYLCWSLNRLKWSYLTIYTISQQTPERQNELESFVHTHSRDCFNNKVLIEWIHQGKLEWIQLGLSIRFGTLEIPAKHSNNNDKLLTAFAIYFEDIEHREPYKLKQLLHILHILIQYYLFFPVYWSHNNEISLTEKKKILLNLIFISGYIPFIEYTIQFLIVDEQNIAKEQKRKINYDFLEWSSYSRDKEVYRQANVYSISSSFEHSCMGYMLLYYTGEDPDLIAIMRQMYKEQLYVSKRRMSIFTLE
jgi:hypothetical protein